MKMASAIISSLPRLRILDVSPEIAVIVPIKRLPPTVKVVAIVAMDYLQSFPRHQVTHPISAMAWKAVHVLLLDVSIFHTGMLDTQVNFQSVTHFTLRDDRYEILTSVGWEIVGRVLDNWVFPSLQTVVIKYIGWPTMSKFLQRHSITLRSLYFGDTRRRLEADSVWQTKALVLPNLQELKLEADKNPFAYLNIDPIALESFDLRCKLIIEEGLPCALDFLGRYQNLKFARISGCFDPDKDPAKYLLEHVVDQLATLRKRGVMIEFHGLPCDYAACKGECRRVW